MCTEAELLLHKAEREQLLRSGYLEIDDPVRGHIQVRLFFDELRPGLVGKQGRLNVLRAGTAATIKK
jgi:hypothetical protein